MAQFAEQINAPSAANHLTLGELVKQAQQGEHAAFAALFEQYNAPICRYLTRLVGNIDLGHDLAQDTFLQAWRSLSRLRDSEYFGPWLYRIATNLARSHLRHARLIRWLPWATLEQPGSGAHLSLVDPEEQLGQSECVRLALTEITPKYRICLLLQLEGGFSQREISQLLGITEKSVSSNISRGRQQFRLAYRRLEGESPTPLKGARPS